MKLIPAMALATCICSLWVQFGCNRSVSSDQVLRVNADTDQAAPEVSLPIAADEADDINETKSEENEQSPSVTPPKKNETARVNPRNVRRMRPLPQENKDQRVRPRLNIRRGGLRDLTFDDLEFNIERDADFERSMLTSEIEELNGKQVVLRGFMLPSFQQSGITEFILVRDNQECCFGPGAYIYHNVQIAMDPGKSASYGIRPITVKGAFSIKPYILEGKCYSVYHIQASSAK